MRRPFGTLKSMRGLRIAWRLPCELKWGGGGGSDARVAEVSDMRCSLYTPSLVHLMPYTNVRIYIYFYLYICYLFLSNIIWLSCHFL